jgi:hypothetical protein
MLGYLAVIILDNVLVWHTNKTIARQTSSGIVAEGDSQGTYVATSTSERSGEEV